MGGHLAILCLNHCRETTFTSSFSNIGTFSKLLSNIAGWSFALNCCGICQCHICPRQHCVFTVLPNVVSELLYDSLKSTSLDVCCILFMYSDSTPLGSQLGLLSHRRRPAKVNTCPRTGNLLHNKHLSQTVACIILSNYYFTASLRDGLVKFWRIFHRKVF